MFNFHFDGGGVLRHDLRLIEFVLWLEDPVAEQGSKNGAFRSTLEPMTLAPFAQRFHFNWTKHWQKLWC
ncbi:hypothetical protein AB4156_17220 [Cupriavidus sp. 2MCAB6]|uniref:hypothetical protein n=1 Tax=Cupriavidus sp. 2MCAB6 TaxID=3232981 RepID=UPI003F920708